MGGKNRGAFYTLFLHSINRCKLIKEWFIVCLSTFQADNIVMYTLSKGFHQGIGILNVDNFVTMS